MHTWRRRGRVQLVQHRGDINLGVLRIAQSKENGYYKFNGTETTSQLEDRIWLGAEIGGASRAGWKPFRAEVNESGNTGGANWYDSPEVGVWSQEIGVPNAKTKPVKRVSLDMPFGGMYDQVDDSKIHRCQLVSSDRSG